MGTMFVNLSSGRVLQHGPQQGFIPFKEWKIVVQSPACAEGGNCDKAPIEGQPPDRAKSSMLGRGFSKKGKPGLRQRFSRQLFVPSYLPRENQ
ncbi:MAG: hypothetical protein ABSA62_13310 [Methyloceanibacter sp.]|jgi:hypothetical protein